MPTYDYRCNACGHEFEQFQSIKDAPLKKCPSCGKAKLERLIGTGAAILFKGSGFYETDYRSEGYKKAAEADKPASDAKPETKPDSKPDAKAESKAEPKSEPAKAAEPASPKASKPKAKAKPAKKR